MRYKRSAVWYVWYFLSLVDVTYFALLLASDVRTIFVTSPSFSEVYKSNERFSPGVLEFWLTKLVTLLFIAKLRFLVAHVSTLAI